MKTANFTESKIICIHLHKKYVHEDILTEITGLFFQSFVGILTQYFKSCL